MQILSKSAILPKQIPGGFFPQICLINISKWFQILKKSKKFEFDEV